MNNHDLTTRKARRAANRAAAKKNKKRALQTMTAMALMGALGTGTASAALASPLSLASVTSQKMTAETRLKAPTLAGMTLQNDTLRANFLTDSANPNPDFTLTVEADEDASALPGLEAKRDAAKERWDELAQMQPAVQASYDAWSSVTYEWDESGETIVFLNDGSVERFVSYEEARAHTASQVASAVEFFSEYDKAETAYQRAEANVNKFTPSASQTSYSIIVDATESGFSGAIQGVNLYDGELIGVWDYQIDGYLQVEGAPEGALFHIIENSDGIMKLKATFPEDTPIIASRVAVDRISEKPVEEVPEDSEDKTTVLDARTENVRLEYFSQKATIDLLDKLPSGVEVDRIEISSADGGYGQFVYTSRYDYMIEDTDLAIYPSWEASDGDDFALSYRIWDMDGKSYTGALNGHVSAAETPAGLSPIKYDPADSRLAFVDSTMSLGVKVQADQENGNMFNFKAGRLVKADGAYATADAAFGYQGQRIALRPTANDAAGQRDLGYSRDTSVDPNVQREIFASNTLQVKNPKTGEWTSTGYTGKNGKVSILPAAGTDEAVLGSTNEFAEAVIAFDPSDRSKLISEQTEYRVAVVKYGETIEDVEAFWESATESDYLTSTATFGIKEWEAVYTPALQMDDPYCFLPDNMPDSLSDREHGSFLNRSDFRSSNGGSTGSGSSIRFCAPEGTVDKAEVLAGQTVTMDVLANDRHFSTSEGLGKKEEKNYGWDRDSLRILTEDGEPVMSLETDRGFWKVVDGELAFTANDGGLNGIHSETVQYSATEIWVGDPAVSYEYEPFMTKRAGGTVTGVAANVLIHGGAVGEPGEIIPTPEVPEVPTPEVPTPEVPEVPTPEVPTPEVPVEPSPEVPEVPTPEVPTPEVPTPEVPVEPSPEVPTPEVPEVPTPEVPTPEVPETETVRTDDEAKTEIGSAENEGVTETGAEKPAGILAGLLALLAGLGIGAGKLYGRKGKSSTEA